MFDCVAWIPAITVDLNTAAAVSAFMVRAICAIEFSSFGEQISDFFKKCFACDYAYGVGITLNVSNQLLIEFLELSHAGKPLRIKSINSQLSLNGSQASSAIEYRTFSNPAARGEDIRGKPSATS